MLPVLRRFGLREVIDEKVLDLPILLHYGRSDLLSTTTALWCRRTGCGM